VEDAGCGSLHYGCEGDLLGPELGHEVLSALTALPVGFGLVTIGEADVVQRPISELPGLRPVDAVDELLPGEADLVLLGDDGVPQGVVQVLTSFPVDAGDFSPLGGLLVALLLLRSDFFRDGLWERLALAGLNPVGLGGQLVGAEDALLGGLDVSALDHTVVSTETAVGSICHQGLLLDRDDPALVSDPGVGGVDLYNIVRVPVQGDFALEEGVRLDLDGLLFVFIQRNLFIIDFEAPVLNKVMVSLGGSQCDLGLALKNGDVLVSVDLLGEDRVLLVL